MSYDRVGDVLVAQGNLTAALQAYRDGLAIAERLAQADPGNAKWQRDLAVSHAKLGLSLRRSGDVTGALAAFRHGHSLLAAIVRIAPDHAGWRRDLAWFDAAIAALADAAPDRPAARRP